MARPRFQLTGHVVHVGPAATAPAARSTGLRILRWAGVAVVVPAAIIAVGIIRFTFGLARALAGQTTSKKATPLNHYGRNILVGWVLTRVESAGQIQVTHVRVRDSAGQIFAVRVEGHFVSGAIAAADSVTFRLRQANGVYVVTDGDNHTTREPIRLKR